MENMSWSDSHTWLIEHMAPFPQHSHSKSTQKQTRAPQCQMGSFGKWCKESTSETLVSMKPLLAFSWVLLKVQRMRGGPGDPNLKDSLLSWQECWLKMHHQGRCSHFHPRSQHPLGRASASGRCQLPGKLIEEQQTNKCIYCAYKWSTN